MIEKKYDKYIGKTRKLILEIMKEDQFNDPHSDQWIFYMDKDFFWRKRYLYLFFENDKVVRSSIIIKNFWEKNERYD